MLPSVELCEQTRKPCKVVETYSGWPDFLQCNNTNFPSGCSIGVSMLSCDLACLYIIIKATLITNNNNNRVLCSIKLLLPTVTDYLVQVIGKRQINMYMLFNKAELYFGHEPAMVSYSENIL